MTTDTNTPEAAIWRQPMTVHAINTWGRVNMTAHLGITFTDVGPDYLEATMPVDERTTQPYGILHGGASVVLAETLGSVAASCCVDRDRQVCVGLEINANHIRAVEEGHVTGTARPLHLGRSTQVWEVTIRDDRDRLVCASRLTLAVLNKEGS